MREMKDSGVEWIGEIPVEWNCSKIKHHFKIGSGTTPKSDIPSYWDGDIVWITPADFKTDDVYVSEGHRNLTQEGFESSTLEIIPAGNIIFSKRAPIGQVVINSVDLCTNQGCLTAVPLDKSNVKYYRYAMSAATNQFELAGSGTTFKEISATAFGNFILPSPSVSEQKKITEYLDRKCSSIDSVIMKQQVIIEKLKEYKLSTITEATTQGIRESTLYKDSNIKWLNRIPANWDVSSLGKISTSIRNGYVGPTRDIFVEEGGIPYIQSLHVKDGKINLQNNEYNVSEEWGKKHPKVSEGQLLIVQTGDIGQVGLVSKEMEGYNCHALIITSLDKKYVIPEFVVYYLRGSIGKELMLDTRTGALLPHLNSGKIKNTPVVIPPIQEQSEIVDFLNLKCVLIDKAILHKIEIIDKLEAYKKSLIYEIVTGKREV